MTKPTCQCGCGQLVAIATRNEYRRGWTKGEPVFYRQGHRPRSERSYKHVNRKLVTNDTSVLARHWTIAAHVARAVIALGHPLPAGAQVHHADGSRDERAPLVICQDQRYHLLLHVRQRVLAAGGNPNTQRICSCCKRLTLLDGFGPSTDPIRQSGLSRVCRECVRSNSQARRDREKAMR